MKNKFKLTHVILYAKGWYKKTDDVWEDLKQILKLDDYDPHNYVDVYVIILNATYESELYRWTDLKEVLIGIHPTECWKYGYYTKHCKWSFGKQVEELPEYDMPTAFIYYVLRNLRNIPTQEWNPEMPKVSRYPKNPEISIRQLYDMFVMHTEQK